MRDVRGFYRVLTVLGLLLVPAVGAQAHGHLVGQQAVARQGFADEALTWHESLASAVATARKGKKPILVYVLDSG